MKKILSTILFTMSFIATAHAETSISLTPTQSQAVEKLTDSSVQILDVGNMVQSLQKAKGYEGLLKEGNPKQTCMNEKFASTRGYQQYQHERAIKYVIAKTPQQIEQDLQLLNPKFVATAHDFFDILLQGKTNSLPNNNAKSEDQAKAMLNDPATARYFMQLLFDPIYRDLRGLLNIEKEDMKNNMGQYMLWSMQQCDVKVDELRRKNK